MKNRNRRNRLIGVVGAVLDTVGGTRPGDPSPAIGAGRSRATPTRAPLAETVQLVVAEPADHDRDVARLLVDPTGPAPGPGAEPLEGRALVGEAGRDIELLGGLIVVVHGVGDSRTQHLVDLVGGQPLREEQDLTRLGDVLASDQVEHDPGLGGRHPHVAALGLRSRPLVGLGPGHRRPLFSCPAW